MNTGLPGWAVLLIAWGIASVATAAVWSAVKGIDRRLAPLDMGDLTDDAPVDELLTRLERFNSATDVSLQVATCKCRKCNPAVSR